MKQHNVGSLWMAIDIAGSFTETSAGNKYTLVAMDYFGKKVEAYAKPNQGLEYHWNFTRAREDISNPNYSRNRVKSLV